jgi:Phosphoinositide phospholipase C, Ca2+-dependent
MRMPAALILAAVAAATLAAESPADHFRLNQIQVLGSHNSYKQAIDPSLLQLLRKNEPRRYAALEYSHAPLAEQLDLGLRKLEIDVVYDPRGGLYAHPLGLTLLKEAGLSAGAPYDPEGQMAKPGFKVLHVPDIDFRSHAYTFRGALQQVRAWSDAHPRHLPIMIMMNAKDSGIDLPNAVRPLPFTAAALDAWDAEIREILPPAKLLTPDDVRGEFPTLEAAVLAHAWPTLGKARGRFLFVLDETGEKLETYVKGHPSLRGRVMFVNALEGRPEAAFFVVNDPVGSFHYIQKLVRAGYLVRTRADADTREARQGDYVRMKAAFDSGAQYVSTDYYQPNPDFGTGYQVTLPGGGPGRWNPLLAPPLKDLPPLE